MRKKEMIDLILEEEKNLWRKLKLSIQVRGYDDKVTGAIRNQWCAIYRLIQNLDLHSKRG